MLFQAFPLLVLVWGLCFLLGERGICQSVYNPIDLPFSTPSKLPRLGVASQDHTTHTLCSCPSTSHALIQYTFKALQIEHSESIFVFFYAIRMNHPLRAWTQALELKHHNDQKVCYVDKSYLYNQFLWYNIRPCALGLRIWPVLTCSVWLRWYTVKPNSTSY